MKGRLPRTTDSETRRLAGRSLLERSDRIGFIVGASMMASLLAVFAASVSHDAAVSREALTERFQTRASLSASFVTGYVQDLATREEDHAVDMLSQADVSQADFDQLVDAFDFDVAGLFDANGRMLQIWPPSPDLIGEPFADRYPHIATALSGTTGVSGVVASAATSTPVIAVAVPFETTSGRRVLSGAFRPGTGSLGTYFDTVIPLGGRTYLIDSIGNIVVTGESGAISDFPPMLTPGALLRLDQSVGTFESHGDSFTYVREPVAGTPWHVILTTPTTALYKPVDGSSQVSWMLFAAFAITGTIGLVLFFRLARAHSVSAALARLDALTLLPNRRAGEEHLARTASAASRHSRTYGVLMIDIDWFKHINDTYGHQAGDQVLCLVARTLRGVARVEDVVSRWGGEEFLVVISATSEENVAVVAERFRAAIADATTNEGDPAQHLNVTISVGGAVSTDRDPQAALHAADAALYDAKLSGRNQVVIYRDGANDPLPTSLTDAVESVPSRH